MNKTLYNFSIYTSLTFFQKGISFIMLPIYTMLLSPYEFGIFNQLIAIGSIMILFFLFAMDEGAAFYLFKNRIDQNEKSKIFSSVFIVSTLISIFGSGVFFLLHDQIFTSLKIEVTQNIIYVFLSYLIASPLFFIYQKILRINEEGLQFAKIMFLNIISQVIVAIILITQFDYGGIGLFLSHAITSVIFYFFSLLKLFNQYRLVFNLKRIKKVTRYALPILPHKLSGWGLNGLTILSISYFLGSKSVGIFTALSFLSIIINIFSKSFFNAYQPVVYKMMEEGRGQKLKIFEINKMLGISMIALATFLTFFSKEIITVFINARYHENFIVLPILIFSSLCLFLGSLFTYILYFNRDGGKYVSISTFTGLFINLLLTIILTPNFGLKGAVSSLAISNFATSILKYFFAKKIINYRKEEFFNLFILAITLCLCGIILETMQILIFTKVIIFILCISLLLVLYKKEFKKLKKILTKK
jgi:O-antigen/teichoic acid export membrane protein